MKFVRSWAPLLLAFAWLSCQSVGDIDPIVIDLSAARTPTAIPAASTATPPAPTSLPAPTPTPAARVAASSPPASRSPEAVAQKRIDAYNKRDLEPLVSLYASDARIFDPPDRVRDAGLEEIRQTYSRRFSSPDWSRIETVNRMTEGNFVVERENESGPGGRSQSAIVISEIREGRIVRVWILR